MLLDVIKAYFNLSTSLMGQVVVGGPVRATKQNIRESKTNRDSSAHPNLQITLVSKQLCALSEYNLKVIIGILGHHSLP